MKAHPGYLLAFAAGLLLTGCGAQKQATIAGEPMVWHTLTLSFEGPALSEIGEPNPFTDYRLDVEFEGPSGAYRVPGFYAADGAAAETGAEAGSVWQARFTPDAEGEWRYTASFRTGEEAALADSSEAGSPAAFDGASGGFTVGPSDKTGRDFRAHGILRYVGRRYLQFAGSREYFLKGGADSPENLLAYRDFDATRPRLDTVDPKKAMQPVLHAYEPHVADWREGDPAWRDGRGKGLIGGLNYLASKGVNSVYFLVMNVTGDGDDVWPWIDPDVRDRFDVSKLDQWEIVFRHMDRLGMMLHVVTAETENDHLLDGGDVGRERKLYYRELVARFAHHPALIWNLGEENTNSDAQRRAQAELLHDLDPYDHPVVMHTFATPDAHEKHYAPLLGYERFEGASMQIRNDELVHSVLIEWIERSRDAGRPWIVAFDEQRTGRDGVAPDAVDPDRSDERRDHLWASLMAGAWGIEWYFGYEFEHNDVNLEDWRSRESIWEQTAHALDFFHEHLPFWEMESADELTAAEDDFVFAKRGEVYAVYLPQGGSSSLDLEETNGDLEVLWYDPGTGGELQTGSVAKVSGPGVQSLGAAPSEPQSDWAILIRRPDPQR